MLFLFLGTCFVTTAQININIEKSEIFKDDKKHTELEFVEGDGKGGLVTVRLAVGGLMKKPKEYYISYFDENLKLISEKTFEVEKNEFKGLMVKDGQVHILDFGYNRKTKAYDFDILSTPLSSFEFTRQTLFSIDKDRLKKEFSVYIGFVPVVGALDQFDNDSFGEVVFSKDKNFFAVNFDIKDKKQETHQVLVFNDKFEQIFEKEITRDTKDSRFIYQNTEVDDGDGTVYFLGKEREGRLSKKDGKANYHYELISVSPNGQIQETSFKNDIFVASLTVAKYLDQLVAVGFYSEKNDYRYKGVVRFDLNPENLSMTKKSFLPFDERFLFDKYGSDKDKELRNLSYRDIFISESGDVILNAEEYFITQNYNMNGAVSFTYHFNDIISCKISSEGELVWARNVNKVQSSGRPTSNFNSYASMIENETLYIFLNSRRVREKNDGRIKFKGNGDLFALTIASNGDLDYKTTIEDPEVSYFVEYGKILGQNKMILVGRDGRKKRIIRLSVD
ncbi:MAG TPA: hypothetical protein VFM82_11635 [Flavobacteriaceae bacterium]|nr:hypothetical protein [Flavobacteriaceae bacterium]